ncbi:MAG: polysaccharide deacetylase family protein [Rhizomicrobium sp.]
MMHIFKAIIGLIFMQALTCMAATAAPCASTNVLGTSGTLSIHQQEWPTFGKNSQYPILPLQPHQYILTFDDGPATSTTPAILAILRDQCVKATMFMIGRRASQNPTLVKDAFADGHTMGSHSWSHAMLQKIPYDAAISEIVRGYEAVETAEFGKPRPPDSPRLFRFPDEHDTAALLVWAQSHKIAVAGVDLTPSDWRNDPPDVTFKRFKNMLDHVDRGIILLHDGLPNTVQLLPKILDELRARHASIIHLTVQ